MALPKGVRLPPAEELVGGGSLVPRQMTLPLRLAWALNLMVLACSSELLLYLVLLLLGISQEVDSVTLRRGVHGERVGAAAAAYGISLAISFSKDAAIAFVIAMLPLGSKRTRRPLHVLQTVLQGVMAI